MLSNIESNEKRQNVGVFSQSHTLNPVNEKIYESARYRITKHKQLSYTYKI